MGSKFFNLQLARSVARYLGVKDQKDFPRLFHTDELQPVLSITGPTVPDIWAGGTLTNKFLVGIPNWWYSIFGGLVGVANDTMSPDPDSDYQLKAHWLRQCRLLVSYDAAGSAADAGKILVFLVYLYNSAGAGFAVLQHQCEVKSGLNFYEWIFPECNVLDQSVGFTGKSQWGKGWNGYIPPGWRCVVGVSHNPSANFPANTTVNGEALIATSPEGVTYQGP